MNDMAGNKEKEFWIDFFEVYRQFPEVWKIKSEIYKNKVLKKKAYEVLLGHYKQIDENATEEILKRKINNFRSCYRRELKKVNNSYRSGCSAEDIYVPNLWYYDALNFLKDQETQLEGISSIDIEMENDGTLFEESTASSSSIYQCSPPVRNRKRFKLDRNQVLLKAVENLGSQIKKKDDADILAAGWATCFRKLDADQQLFANKTINEVLFQAALGKLTAQSHKAFETQTEIQSIPSTSSHSCANIRPMNITYNSPTSFSEDPPRTAVYIRPRTTYPYTVVRKDSPNIITNSKVRKRTIQEVHNSQEETQSSYTSLDELFKDPDFQS